jgi:2-polyprenyl-3-methyl-5-hydroxy-6-metoxy-1,4-benzoquinol methylase
MDEQAVRKYLEVIRRACDKIEEQLGKPTTTKPVVATQSVKPTKTLKPEDESEEHNKRLAEEQRLHKEARRKHADELFGIDCWPLAVPNHLMRVPNDQDQINRATAVLDMTLSGSLEGLNFLDYGCGDGWITAGVLKRGVVSTTGYDIAESPVWNKHPSNVIFTTDRKALTKGSYDCIFLYDVIDHVYDPVDVMNHVKSLLKPKGVVYVRCHPWCSKHASHLFKIGLNRAFIHLFLSWEELAEKGYEQMFTRQETDPIRAYHYWFHQFNIVKETFQRTPLSDFFLVPEFKKLVWDQQQIPPDRQEGFIKDMEIEFVDYRITH